MAMTLGMMAALAQSTPKTSVSFLRFCVAASRIEKTVSPSQLMHRLPSFSSKNCTPSWLASKGMYSMMASRTRHCLSSASCTMAGSSDCESSSMPITWLTSSSLEMMCRRTSGNSSLSICRNMGRRCAMVLWDRVSDETGQGLREAHSSLPRMGAKPLICVPSAALTCCDVSPTRSSMLPMISFKRISRSIKAQKPTLL